MSAVRTFLRYSKEASKLRGMWLWSWRNKPAGSQETKAELSKRCFIRGFVSFFLQDEHEGRSLFRHKGRGECVLHSTAVYGCASHICFVWTCRKLFLQTFRPLLGFRPCRSDVPFVGRKNWQLQWWQCLQRVTVCFAEGRQFPACCLPSLRRVLCSSWFPLHQQYARVLPRES